VVSACLDFPSSAPSADVMVRAHASAAGDIPIDDEGAFTDVDTPEEYQRLVRF